MCDKIHLIAKFLLTINKVGKELRKKIVSALNIQAALRLEYLDKICSHWHPKQVNTNLTEADKHKLQKTDGKVVAACLVRDLFGRIHSHSPTFSLTHVDGTMQKTSKATLMNHLESEVTSTSPPLINTTIIDASFSSICRRALPFHHVLAQ